VNVILYVMDALRADHLSCYGYERDISPNIDALADDGVRFERCFSPATWTRPVASSLLTGLYPPAHGTETRNDLFSPPVQTLAERFQDAGYETVGITTMGNLSSEVRFDRGFDRFFDLYKDDDVISKRRTSTPTEEELKQENVDRVALPRAEDITDTFAEWLTKRDDDRPFFAFAWSIEPHMPYDPPPEFRGFLDPGYDGVVDGERDTLNAVESESDLAQFIGLYDGEIAYNDHCIGTLVDLLRDAGCFADTLFSVAGDHGDAFREHGRLTHGHAPYDELMHVPWVVRTPSAVSSTDVADGLCSLIDVAPTLLDTATDGSVDPSAGIQGRPAMPGRPDGPLDREHVFSKTTSYDMQSTFYGVRSDGWKYIRIERPSATPGNVVGTLRYVLEKGILTDILRNPGHYLNRYFYDENELLFDLQSDPDETENLAQSNGERRERLEAEIDAWIEACEALNKSAADASGEIGAETKEQLRQLGYTE